MALQESERELERGETAPDFSLPGADGEPYSLADFADNDALLIVFTCNHCPYAKAKIETLNAIAADYERAAVVAINPNNAEAYPEDSFEAMERAVSEGPVAYDAYLHDESQDVARAYGATCTPDPFLFERDNGTFRLAYHGRLDDATGPDEQPTEEPGFEMRRAIDSVLVGESIADSFRPSRGCSIKWR